MKSQKYNFTMNFGFLIDDIAFSGSHFSIAVLPGYYEIVKDFYNTFNVSNGWIYGVDKQLSKNVYEQRKFKEPAPVIKSKTFWLNPTHQISSNIDDDYMKFMILAYGFLQGLYLIPEGHIYLTRIPYEKGKLNGMLLSNDDYKNGMERISEFYFSSSPIKRKQMFSCIHWFLISQTYDYQWEVFDGQYKVLDGIFKMSGLNASNHSARPVELAKHFKLQIPSWAVLGTDNKSKLSKLRNELYHEAKYVGEPIGYEYPDENYSLEFRAFNLKLIIASLGINTSYLKSDPENRGRYGWYIQP